LKNIPKRQLVGGFNLPLRKMMEFVSWDDEIPNKWKNHPFKFQSPPTRTGSRGIGSWDSSLAFFDFRFKGSWR
jgi:hypothetical protein